MLDVIDTGMVQDIWADGIARLEIIGAQVRFVMFSWQWFDGKPERVVVAKVVRPLGNLPAAPHLLTSRVVRLTPDIPVLDS